MPQEYKIRKPGDGVKWFEEARDEAISRVFFGDAVLKRVAFDSAMVSEDPPSELED